MLEPDSNTGALIIVLLCMALPYLVFYFLPVNAKFRKATSLLKKKEYEDAVVLFTELINKKNDHHQFYIQRAAANIELNKFDNAIRDLERSARLKPENYLSFVMLSFVYQKLNNNKMMHYFINQALLKNPPRYYKYMLMVGLGIYWDNKNEFDKAVETYKKAMEILDNDSTAYNNIGYALLNLNKFGEAIGYLNTAIKIDPAFAFAYNNRGFCYANLGDFEKAFNDFGKSLRLDSGNSYLYKFRGIANKLRGNFREALNDLETAIKKNPDFEPEINPIINEIRENL